MSDHFTMIHPRWSPKSLLPIFTHSSYGSSQPPLRALVIGSQPSSSASPEPPHSLPSNYALFPDPSPPTSIFAPVPWASRLYYTDPAHMYDRLVSANTDNFHDDFPMFIIALLLAGWEYPIRSACYGMVYLGGRVCWTLGFTTGDLATTILG
ncbi:hypothetical protein SAICODRAFT_192033 [Saitoella complicata NRRL Y-17804]|uniref:uncharacterized protein n=1 Tax=Saitoella complicata (strain BCRC 22490 / CBS 7301 / JCM 7358 / NBRC 10748 / NRRL Y-17804) TaxID=698492 RepID=UPI0008676661|nr:uncharacterized protein SAICODRAFT_192033 [Saitoella complicata NRRL Y-17804]ODQ49691.1 hypothetical protein SAICODRAFT_192033 [Saitoella complicata NRRL Y-17804]